MQSDNAKFKIRIRNSKSGCPPMPCGLRRTLEFVTKLKFGQIPRKGVNNEMDKKRKGCCKSSKGLALRNSKGFTLIELLVVIAIIGILATIVLVSLNTARQKARNVQRVADVKQMQTALEMYFDKNAGYPIVLSDLVADGFLPAVPLDPLGSAFQYAYFISGASRTNYHLGTAVVLEGETEGSGVLAADADFNSSGVLGWTGGFDGTAGVYDAKP